MNLLRVLRYQPPDLNTPDWISELLRGDLSCLTRHSFIDGAEAAILDPLEKIGSRAGLGPASEDPLLPGVLSRGLIRGSCDKIVEQINDFKAIWRATTDDDEHYVYAIAL